MTENDSSDEVRRLRRTMEDLVAFSNLPATWVGLGPDGIANGLVKALLGTLDLDLVYVRLTQPKGSGFTETVRSKHRPDADHCISEAKVLLAPLFTGVALVPVTLVRDPFGPGTLRTTVTRFDLVEERGVLVAGSQRVNFPTEQEQLLLRFAANQAIMASQHQWAEHALQQSEERFRDFANAAPAMLWVTEPDGSCSFLSQGWYEFTDQGEDEGLGLGWLSAIHPDDREAAGKHFLSANERHEAFSNIVCGGPIACTGGSSTEVALAFPRMANSSDMRETCSTSPNASNPRSRWPLSLQRRSSAPSFWQRWPMQASR